MAVPPARLEAVAALVSAHPGVNHNYEREHALNLWFVMTNTSSAGLDKALSAIENEANLPVTRLRMVRPYRIDLGFDLRPAARPAHQASPSHTTRQTIAPVAVGEERLAALVEEGLPLIARPYAAWAQALGWPVDQVTQTLSRWLTHGTLRRLGVVVRHHDLGICANAMTVLDVPDHLVDAAGARLASQPGVTLCYRRLRDGDWPYNLYFMVHGHDRASVELIIEQAIQEAALCALPRQSLFSGQRFKQTGGRYFRDPVAAAWYSRNSLFLEWRGGFHCQRPSEAPTQ